MPNDTTGTPHGSGVVTFDGATTAAQIVAVANGARPVVAAERYRALEATRKAAAEISSRMPTYGRTTGVGANRTTAAADREEHGMRLVRSHAADAGPDLDDRTVRAMLAVRLAQLATAGSGIDPDIVRALEDQLRANALPRIGAVGGIGTGDLTALAAAALALAGARPTTPAIERHVFWDAGSALPFISSSALTIGRGCLAADALQRIERAATAVYGLGIVALDGNLQPLSPAAARAVAAPGVEAWAARALRLLDGHEARPAKIQDPYGLRAFPIVHAALETAHERLTEQLERLLSAAQENPVFDVDRGFVAHHGAFYQAQLAIDLEATTLAMVRAATISHALLRLAIEPGDDAALRPFLAGGPAGASGLMMIEYTAASALAELRNAADPASRNTISISRGAEEDASFASQAAVQLERAVEAHRIVLGCTLLAVARRVQQRSLALPPGLRGAANVLAALNTPAEDHDVSPWIGAAVDALDDLADVAS